MKPKLLALAIVAAAASLHAIDQQASPPPGPIAPKATAPATTSPHTTQVRPMPPAGSNPAMQGGRIGTISGLVVDATDGRTLARVAVRLYGRGVMQTRLTDDKGRVTFSDLPPGDFTINATKARFFDGSYGKRRAGGTGMPLSLPAGQSISDLKIELFKPAVISGYVFDDGNEPIIGAQVVALRREFTGGQWRFTPIGSEVTDDEGSYRIFGLMPGEYIVSVPSVQVTMPIATFEAVAATGSSTGDLSAFFVKFFLEGQGPGGGERLMSRLVFDKDDRHVLLAAHATPPPAEGRREFAYPTQYYPTADAIPTALPVSIVSGEDHRGVNFALRPVRTARIEGMVVGPNGAVANQTLRLLPVDTDDFGLGTETAATVSAPDGTFAFLRVPAGRYTIEARSVAGLIPSTSDATGPPILVDTPGSQPTLWGRASVALDDADVDDVIVLMAPSLTVNGRAVFEGNTTRPTPEQLGRIPVSLTSASGAAGPVTQARLDASGQFVIRGLVPGEYFVRVDGAPPGWYLKSAIAAGRDVSDSALELSSGADMAVTITFTDRATEVAGTVRDARGLAAAGATVIAMPASATTGRLNPTRTREVRTSSTGVFTISGLPSGDYYFVAIDDAASEGWQDPARLVALRNLATRLTLRDAEKRSLELRTSVRR